MKSRAMWHCLFFSAITVAMGCGDSADANMNGNSEPGEEQSEGESQGGEGQGGESQEGESQEGESQEDDGLSVVTLADGRVRGEREDGAIHFYKIPYAKPPVGALRWQAPQANDPWEGELAATEMASACPQPESRQTPGSDNEDCLYLNVWRPALPVGKAPVMVWIHGGGNRSGSAADAVPTSAGELWYDGKVFAERHGIVVVSMNYRLGPFGFFSHPALAEEGGAKGNQGLLDQQLALQWVRDNIAAFGGDPDNVTLFGESAGSANVCMHVASPLSRGLFHRAISQSGGCTGRRPGDRATLDAAYESFASELGCADETSLDCLRDKSVEEILAAASQGDITELGSADGSGASLFGPIAGDEFLPVSADEAFASGDVAKVPYILGSNTEEGTLFFISTTDLPTDDESYEAELERRWGEERAERVLELYPPSAFDGDHRAALIRAFGDSFLVCGTTDTAHKAEQAGLDVYMYNFNVPWSIAGGALGPTHAAEISHAFGTPYDDTPESEQVAESMNAYWAQFARTGDPNGPDAPVTWPKLGGDAEDGGQRLQIDADWQILSGFREAECAMWLERESDS